MDLLTMAKYPYMSETVTHIREHGPNLEDLNTSPIYQSVRVRGKERVVEAIKNNNITDKPVVSDSDAIAEILSYIVSRILVSAVNNLFLTRRYATSESKLMNERMQNETVDFILNASTELGINALTPDIGSSIIHIDVTDYLRHSSTFRSDDYKLVNQDLKDGHVRLNQRRFIRLLEHAILIKIENELPLPVNNEIKKSYDSEINEIKSLLGSMKKKYEVKDFGKLDLNRLPPCMKQILAMAQAGENLPHSARFSITAFLHTIGLNSEEILKIFGASPDFDPSIARYQVEHITGEGSGTEYIPPSCAKMKSYGLCYNHDSLCNQEWLTHPLKYYRTKSRKSGKSKQIKASRKKEIQKNKN